MKWNKSIKDSDKVLQIKIEVPYFYANFQNNLYIKSKVRVRWFIYEFRIWLRNISKNNQNQFTEDFPK